MKTARLLLLSLLTASSLLIPVSSQAETIFERFAPPLPNIVIRSSPPRERYESYHEDYRGHRPPPRNDYWRERDYPPPRHYHRDEYWHRDGWRDHDRRWHDHDRRWRD